MNLNKDLIKQAKEILTNEASAILSCEEQINHEIEKILELLLNCNGHVLVTGAGTSRTIAQRFAHLLSCCGTPALFLNASDALNGSAGAIKSIDVLYLISKGGSSQEINKLAKIAKGRNATIISQTENPKSELAQTSDAVFVIKSPNEVDPYGMIATGSSLVNAAATDVLSVLLLGLRNYSEEQFATTHPEGAVGKTIEAKYQKK